MLLQERYGTEALAKAKWEADALVSSGNTRGTSRSVRRSSSHRGQETRGRAESVDFHAVHGVDDYTHVVPTMEDIVREHEEEGDRMSQLTPKEVLLQLQQGNTRFWTGQASRPEANALERRVMIMNQVSGQMCLKVKVFRRDPCLAIHARSLLTTSIHILLHV